MTWGMLVFIVKNNRRRHLWICGGGVKQEKQQKLHYDKHAIYHFQRGDRLWTSESNVCRRQMMTSKVDPRTDSIKYI